MRQVFWMMAVLALAGVRGSDRADHLRRTAAEFDGWPGLIVDDAIPILDAGSTSGPDKAVPCSVRFSASAGMNSLMETGHDIAVPRERALQTISYEIGGFCWRHRCMRW